MNTNQDRAIDLLIDAGNALDIENAVLRDYIALLEEAFVAGKGLCHAMTFCETHELKPKDSSWAIETMWEYVACERPKFYLGEVEKEIKNGKQLERILEKEEAD